MIRDKILELVLLRFEPNGSQIPERFLSIASSPDQVLLEADGEDREFGVCWCLQLEYENAMLESEKDGRFHKGSLPRKVDG